MGRIRDEWRTSFANYPESTSLTKYNEKYKPHISVRLSMNNLKKDGNILNIPLFLVEYVDKLTENLIF